MRKRGGREERREGKSEHRKPATARQQQRPRPSKVKARHFTSVAYTTTLHHPHTRHTGGPTTKACHRERDLPLSTRLREQPRPTLFIFITCTCPRLPSELVSPHATHHPLGEAGRGGPRPLLLSFPPFQGLVRVVVLLRLPSLSGGRGGGGG